MQSKLDLGRSGADAERIAALEAQTREAAATLAYSQQQLKYTEITAPIAGCVVSDTLQFARGSYRSEEHTSELQSLMRSPYAVFCLINTSSFRVSLTVCLRTHHHRSPS